MGNTFPDRNLFLDFDRFFGNLNYYNKNGFPAQNNYPPHNVIKESDNDYLIEFAVAGYNENEIKVTLEEKNLLVVQGSKPHKEEEVEKKYIHRGISTKSFTKKIILSDSMVVKKAEVSEGILSIWIENVVPEEKKPRVIELVRK
jgi:molecular chaperone IbpA